MTSINVNNISKVNSLTEICKKWLSEDASRSPKDFAEKPDLKGRTMITIANGLKNPLLQKLSLSWSSQTTQNISGEINPQTLYFSVAPLTKNSDNKTR